MINLMITKNEATLMWSLMKIAFELAQDKKFPMGNETLMKVMRPFELLAVEVDKLNGLSQFER